MDSCGTTDNTNDGCNESLDYFLGDFDYEHVHLQRVETTLDRMFALVVLH